MNRIQICADVMWNVVGDDVVVLNIASGTYFALTGVGRRFWELTAEGTPTDEAIERLTAEFEVDVAELERDLDLLIRELQAEGLVDQPPNPPTSVK